MNNEEKINDVKQPAYPASVALKNFKATIINDVNNSGLPAWMMLDALTAITCDVRVAADEMTRKDAEDYNKAVEDYQQNNN